MNNIFERVIIQIRTWLWERERSKNRVPRRRNIDLNERLTLNPYESDYEYLIEDYCKRNTHMFPKDGFIPYVFNPYLFKLYMNNGETLLGFPVQLSEKRLTLRKEKSEQDGYHTALTEEFDIYLFEIKQISAIRASADFRAIYVKEPILGYKSIPEVNGRLLTKGHTYRLNEPNVLEIKSPYKCDFGEWYFHFCTSMEGVALCPGKTDYLGSIKNYAEGRGALRLFRVKAEEHCLEMNDDLDWWVTNKITVLGEVSKEEIYQYYMEHPRARERVEEYYKLTPDFWDEFLKSEITPYVEK